MTEDQAMRSIHRILDEHGQKLTSIQGTLQKIAVQDEQIRALQEDIRVQEHKISELNGPKGCLSEIVKFQASCPRQQIKFLWLTVLPMALTQIGLLVAAVKAISEM